MPQKPLCRLHQFLLSSHALQTYICFWVLLLSNFFPPVNKTLNYIIIKSQQEGLSRFQSHKSSHPMTLIYFFNHSWHFLNITRFQTFHNIFQQNTFVLLNIETITSASWIMPVSSVVCHSPLTVGPKMRENSISSSGVSSLSSFSTPNFRISCN